MLKDKAMKTTITLDKMKFYAYHGVMEQERITGGNYQVDISYTIDTCATETDDIYDTINYAEVYDLVKKEMMITSKLIEHVTGRIFKSIKGQFPKIQTLSLTVSKLNPPVNGEAEKATVTLTIEDCRTS
jgi:dihydroneopterin aldolase